MNYELLAILLPLPIPLAAVAVFSGAETALFSLTYQDRMRLARLAPKAERAASLLLARPRALLILILFLNMVASTLFYVLTALAVLRSTHPALEIGLGVVNVLLMTIVGEVLSKVLAATYRVEVSRFVAPPLLLTLRLTRPVIGFVERFVIAPLARLFTPSKPQDVLTPQELEALLQLGTKEGAIDDDEHRVLRQVLRLSHSRIRDIMTHRVDMAWITADASLDEVVQLAATRASRVAEHAVRVSAGLAHPLPPGAQHATGITRVPVCTSDLDSDLLGLLDVKKFLLQHARGLRPSIQSCLDPVSYVPLSASLDKLLEHFRRSHAKLAVVVDEHGGVAGLVSLQDVASHLIAELISEDDEAQQEQIEQLSQTTWRVPGRLGVRQWAEMFNHKQTSLGKVTTVAGLIFAKLGRIPAVGDAVTIGNLRLQVESMSAANPGPLGVATPSTLRIVRTATVSLVMGPEEAMNDEGEVRS